MTLPARAASVPALLPRLTVFVVLLALAATAAARATDESPGPGGSAAAPAPVSPVSASPLPPGSGDPGTLRRLWRWSDTKISGVFDTILPDTLDPRSWSVNVQPRLGDTLRSDYIRVPTTFQYGFNGRLEGEFEVATYFANPGRGDENGFGVATIRPGLKYRWLFPLDPQVSVATGVTVRRPITSSPARLNEGINRTSTYFTFARPIPCSLDIEGFLNLSYDLITPSSATGSISEDNPQDDHITVGTGALYRTGSFTYGVSINWAHTVDGGSHDFVTLSPTVIYAVPAKYVFNSSGRWQLGGALEAKRFGGETELEARARVRWTFDFKRAYQKWRDARSQQARYDRFNDR